MEKIHWHYITSGSLQNPPLLFLHGFMGNSSDWLSILEKVQHRYYCLALDLPGHGKTRMSGDDSQFKIESTTASIIQYIIDLSLKNINLVGYSMGGRLVLYLAVKYPQYFNRIIIESTSPGLIDPTERLNRKQSDLTLARELERGDMENFLNKWYKQPLFRSLTSHPNFQKLFHSRLSNDPLALAKSLRYMSVGIQPSLWHELHNIQLPVFILVGEKDHKYRKIALMMTEKIPNVTLEVVKDCGHNIHFENEDLYIDFVTYFLSR
jgi:2-succinyl-6-hydroxy-2,4-cyclohexadiene-1-carboxylate synthase